MILTAAAVAIVLLLMLAVEKLRRVAFELFELRREMVAFDQHAGERADTLSADLADLAQAIRETH